MEIKKEKNKVIVQPVVDKGTDIDEIIRIEAAIRTAPLDVLYQILDRLDRIIVLLENR